MMLARCSLMFFASKQMTNSQELIIRQHQTNVEMYALYIRLIIMYMILLDIGSDGWGVVRQGNRWVEAIQKRAYFASDCLRMRICPHRHCHRHFRAANVLSFRRFWLAIDRYTYSFVSLSGTSSYSPGFSAASGINYSDKQTHVYRSYATQTYYTHIDVATKMCERATSTRKWRNGTTIKSRVQFCL